MTAAFNSAWNELATISSARVMKYDFDKAVRLYGETLGLPGLAEIGAGIRDSGAVSVGVISGPTSLREELLRAVDYHLKMQTVNGSLLIYGVKPITSVHGVKFGFELGLPRLSLTEIV